MLLFAQARELADVDRIMLDLPAQSTAADALAVLFQRHPTLASMRNRLAVAVDQRYAPPHTPLHEGCTIALIPPVSGG